MFRLKIVSAGLLGLALIAGGCSARTQDTQNDEAQKKSSTAVSGSSTGSDTGSTSGRGGMHDTSS